MKVFLSYPSEHLEKAHEVYKFVRSVGVDCWFDREDIIGGQEWGLALKIGQSEADLTLILCAAQTTGRNGVHQREIKVALAALEDKREGTIGIVPLRLEKVEVPDALKKFQRVDYFESHWKRKLAASLKQAVIEAGEEIPSALSVAAAQSDEGGITPHTLVDERTAGTLEVTWFSYTQGGEYWNFVNGVIASTALGGLYEARRNFEEWDQPSGAFWELNVSEFYRKDQFVSLVIAGSNYFSGAAHPNSGIETLNILGEEGGIMSACDFFDPSGDGLEFLMDYANLDLKRQFLGTEYSIDLSQYVETYGWSLFDQYNFNETGMQLNFSSACGLPHVMGSQEVYLPWEHAKQFLAPVARKILLDS
jgi:TIR domain